MPEPDTKPNEPAKAESKPNPEDAKWQPDFNEDDLSIPYKREDKNADTADNSKGDDGTVSGDDTEGNEEDTEEYEDTPVPPEISRVEDPGEYTPADYSFDVTLADGKIIKVSTPEEADKIAEDPNNFETPKQLLDFIRRSNKMESKLDKDFEAYEKSKADFDNQQASQAERTETIQAMTKEFEYLVSKGQLPKVDPQYLAKDWTDPEVAKQPGVKEQLALLNYMVKENEVRTKAGIRPLTSIIDTYNAWQRDEGRKQEEAEHKAQVAARKQAGARIAPSSPAQQGGYVPKGIAVGNPNALSRSSSVWED